MRKGVFYSAIYILRGLGGAGGAFRKASCCANSRNTLLGRRPSKRNGVRHANGNRSSQSHTNRGVAAILRNSLNRALANSLSSISPPARAKRYKENLFLFLLRINFSLGISFLATFNGGVVPSNVKKVYLSDDKMTCPCSSSMM